jgi:glycosyltransferase involved in cell wall biosynthesis
MRGGGAERVMSVICNKLVERNTEVYLATNTIFPIEYCLDDRVHVVSLYPKTYYQMLRPLRIWTLLRLIRKIAIQINPDVIVSFLTGMNAKVIMATIGIPIPVITSEHTTYDRVLPWITKFEMLYINKLADKVTVLTQHDYNFLGDRLPNKVVMPNPLSLSPCMELKERRKNILAIGRLDSWKVKGFDNLLKIWANISKLHSDWSLEIAGTGSKESYSFLGNIIKCYELQDSVRLLGFKCDIAKVMQESSLFVLTSRNEGFPMALLEAMSQGCACVSFDCNTGPNEIMTQNVSGILVIDQDLQAMELALLKIIQDEELRNSISRNAVKEVARFSVEKIILKWENLFAQVTKSE